MILKGSFLNKVYLFCTLFFFAYGNVQALNEIDGTVSEYLSQDPLLPQDFDKAWGIATEPLVLGGAMLVTWGTATLLKDKTLSLAMETSLLSFVISMSITTGLKYGINRERPNGGDHSLPSGHATAAFSTATVFSNFYEYEVGIPAFALASFTVFTRLDQSEHYLTDVLLGAIIGTGIGLGTAHYYKKSKEKKTAFITPIISEEGLGLSYYQLF